MRTISGMVVLGFVVLTGCGDGKPPKPTPKDDPSVKKTIEDAPEISIGEEMDPSKEPPKKGDKAPEVPAKDQQPPVPLPSGEGVNANTPPSELVGALGSAGLRETAMVEIKKRGPAMIPELIKLLENEHPLVRAQAAFALGLQGKAAGEAASRLKEIAASDKQDVSRDAAFFALDAIAGN